MDTSQLRCSLRAAGYAPLPIQGKRPPMKDWSQLEATDADIEAWERAYPYAASTGILTKATPALDIDITSEPAAEAVQELVSERFDERGYFLVRIGRAPKRAILFRTDAPFKKISAELISPNGGGGQKLEFLCDGQQLVAFGIHKDTRKPYTWHGGEPGKIKREDLPYIDDDQARQLINDAADLLCREFGYKRAEQRARSNGGDADGTEWAALVDAIKKGQSLHDSLTRLAACLVASGMGTGAAINFLRDLMNSAECEHDARWQERYDDIPRLVESAAEPRSGKGKISATPFIWRDAENIPPRRWIYRHHYVRQYLAATIAPGGLGKTSLAIAEAWSWQAPSHCLALHRVNAPAFGCGTEKTRARKSIAASSPP